MARITDPVKIERIKRTVTELMCESGFGHISIALISEKSGVSSGYLYRFYSGKDELLQDVIESTVDEIKGKIVYDPKIYPTVYDCILNFITRIFKIANADPVLGRLLAKTTQDTNLPSWAQETKNKEIFGIIDEMVHIGRETGEFAPNTTYSDVELVLFSLPFRYIGLQLSSNKSKKFTKEEIVKVTNMCVKALG